MTTVQRMLRHVRTTCGRAGLLIALVASALAGPGCESQPKPIIPARLHAPYQTGANLVWAVAPPRNESGVSIVDELKVGDALAEQIGQVKGIDCLPINRTLAAMRSLRLAAVDSPAQARALARAMGVDGVVVSTITSWQPYDPPRIGMNLALFGASDSMGLSTSPILTEPADVRTLQSSVTDRRIQSSTSSQAPLSAVAAVLDASNQAILLQVKDFGEGRSRQDSAMGWQAYTKSMTLYTQFACHRMVELLLREEHQRLAGSTVTDAARTPAENTR